MATMEAPAAGKPAVVKEDLLEATEIQGNSLAGFRKDHQAFLFLAMERDPASVEQVRAWIGSIAPHISTVAEVARFNELFSQMRKRLGHDPGNVTATWINIAFTADA